VEELYHKNVETIFQVAHIEDKTLTLPKTYRILENLAKAKDTLP
jgi:hypothetical protein